MCAYAIPTLMSLRPLIAVGNELYVIVFELLSGCLAFNYPLFRFRFNRLSRQFIFLSAAATFDTGKTPSLRKLNRVAEEIINSSKCHLRILFLAPTFQNVGFGWECREHHV